VTDRVACVIPAYEAAETLPDLLRQVRNTLPKARVIVVDDGSRDGTSTVSKNLADWTIRLGGNCGKGAALRAAFNEILRSDDDVALTLDADGQHDPAYAPRLLNLLELCDVVIGERSRAGSAMPMRRRMTNAMASMAIARVTGVRLQDTQSGYRAIRREVLERVRAHGDRYEFETDFLIRAAQAGFRVRNAPVPTVYGPVSHFRCMKDSARIVRTIWAHRGASVSARTS
jgi:glycosyltransferase involved in cell wall biosynthesis